MKIWTTRWVASLTSWVWSLISALVLSNNSISQSLIHQRPNKKIKSQDKDRMKPCQQWWGGWGGVCLSHVNWSQSTDFHWSCWCLLLSLTCSIIVNRIENLSSSSAWGHCATPCCRGLFSHLIKLWWHTVIHCKGSRKKKMKKKIFSKLLFLNKIFSPHFMVTLSLRNFYSVR